MCKPFDCCDFLAQQPLVRQLLAGTMNAGRLQQKNGQ